MREIDEFRMEMEKPKEIYTEELKKFIKKYDFLGEVTLIEDPDIDTVDYIYYLNKLNGTAEDILDSALNEIYAHMVNFSQSNGIDEFSENAYVFYASARMPTRLEQFKLRMEGPKKIYTEELKRFVKKYDFLGEMTLVEEPDIETLDYLYYFNKLNGTSKETLDSTLLEIYNHMDDFSKANGIYEYCENAVILFNR